MSGVILLLHAQETARNFLAYALAQQAYLVIPAADADSALFTLQQETGGLVPDLVLAGASLVPALLASPLKRHFPAHRPLPLLALTDDAQVILPEKLMQVSPEPHALLLRLRMLLQPVHEETDTLEHEGLRLDPVTQEAWVGHLRLNLTPLTFRLLHLMLRHPGRVYSRQQLLDTVWTDQGFVEERTVDVHIYRLRGQLTRFGLGHLIEAVRGSGYRLATEKPVKRQVPINGVKFAS